MKNEGQQIGYARVSTQGQDLEQQRIALGQNGFQRIFEEKVSGAKRDRQELSRLLDHLQPGNCLRALQRSASAQRLEISFTEGVQALRGSINLTGSWCPVL